MKTLEQIKDEVAFEKFETRWDTASKFYNEDGVSILEDSGAIDEVIKRYAQQTCEGLRERIAENATLEPNGMLLQVDKQSILETEILLP